MGIELELKLNISSEGELKKIISLIEEREEKEMEVVSMNAFYYDTRDLDLFHNKLVIRVRKENKDYIATLKKAKNNDNSRGLFLREEYNYRVASSKIKINLFTDQRDLLREIVEDKELIKIVESDYIRRKLDINYGVSQLEVALDYGVVKAGGENVPILEMEVELKKGKEKDIFDFAKDYFGNFNLVPNPDSKFFRGINMLRNKITVNS